MIETTTDALLRAILENPADNAIRYAYADALQECGRDEEAEMIKDSPAMKWFRVKSGRWEWRYAGFKSQPEVYANIGSPIKFTKHLKPLIPIRIRKQLDAMYFTNGFLHTIACPMESVQSCGEWLFSRFPIMNVIITDRTPHGDHLEWWWVKSSFLDGFAYTETNLIPDDFFSFLSKIGKGYRRSNDFSEYKSQADAEDDLSKAIVNHYRNLVGLPPLT